MKTQYPMAESHYFHNRRSATCGKTIIMLFIFLTAILPVRAQLLYEDIASPYANPYKTMQENVPFDKGIFEYGTLDLNASALDFNLESFFSGFTPSGNWLINRFGAQYELDATGDWTILPYSNTDTALKIPIGNGTLCLLLIAGLYVLTVFWGLRVKHARTGKKPIGEFA